MAFTMLCWLVAVIAIIIVVNFIKEKCFNSVPVEIALMITGVILGLGVWVLRVKFGIVEDVVNPGDFFLDDYLMNGVLCFMLFAGASRLRFGALKTELTLVTALSLLTTVLTAFFYGGLFYGVLQLFGIDLGIQYCLLLGAIIGPTDPIAAMSILHKIGLPEETALVIEGESLFNDGVGVAVFVVMSGIVTGHANGNFLSIMARELFGAMGIGIICSLIGYFFFAETKDCYARVSSSIMAVGAAYIFSTILECSGAIASVVVGIFFATRVANLEDIVGHEFLVFRTFWSAVDIVLNNMLYVMIGLSIINVRPTPHMVHYVLAALVMNLVARYLGVYIVAYMFKKKLPDGYTPVPFTNLLTWAGLKGGLCVALAMGTHQIVAGTVFNVLMVCTMAIVLFTTCVQGMTVGRVYLAQKNLGSK